MNAFFMLSCIDMYGFLKGRLVAVRVVMLAAAVALIVIGIATIYAVGNPAESRGGDENARLQENWVRQIAFSIAAFAGFLAVNAVNYRRLGAASAGIYAAVLAVLAVLLLDRVIDLPFVPVSNGTRRWIRLEAAGRSISLQPSEVCKAAYVLALAWYLRYRSNYRNFSSLVGPFALTLLPLVMILAEPDLGTALLMMPVLFVMLFVAGAKIKHLVLIVLMAAALSPLMWQVMPSYQKVRVSSVLLQSRWLREQARRHPAVGRLLVGGRFSPRRWKNDWGYHLTRSKYAVASGRLRGYGFRRGPFIKYAFLPERHNDFIFAMIAHQWGFAGCTLVLLLYAVIIACGIEIAGHNTDPFGRLLAMGIVAILAVEVLVNVGMTLGLMPITGLTLPLVSYGGSSMVVSMLCLGLLNNVGRCRPFSVAGRR